MGVVLLLSAGRLLWPQPIRSLTEWSDPPVPLALLIGAMIGLLSGLTGTGGGIFLSPLLLFLAWSAPKPATGVAAVFVLANSVSGLLGNLSSVQELPPSLPLFAGAVLLGALVGTAVGVRMSSPWTLRALGMVLVIAGCKLIGLY
jgi:uncharacterized membrane protein YfcA